MTQKDGSPEIDPAIIAALEGLPDDFVNFGRVYQDEIRPTLLDREGDRVRAADRARNARWMGIGVGVVGVALSLAVARIPMLAFLSAFAGFGVAQWGARDIGKLKGEAKALIVTPVARQFNLDFEDRPGGVESIYRHRDIGIVPKWDRAKFEDRVTGRRGEVDFELFEAHLEERRTSSDGRGRTRTRWVTVFKGQCLRFQFPKSFYGRTLVTRDAGFFNRFRSAGDMQRAILESPEFEKIFEVYTTDQVESRFLLTPDLMQKLVDMETAFHGGKLKCCFDGGELFITVQGGDLFEPGSMFTPLDNPERVRELLNDFAAVFHIIDSVTANRRREERERGS